MINLRFVLRTFTKFRLYTVINLLGLVLSLTCAMVVIRYIYREMTVDHFCKDLDRTYILICEFENRPTTLGGNDNSNQDAAFLDPLDDPAVETYTTYIHYPQDQIFVNEQRYSVNTLVTDSAFLQIMTYPLTVGSGQLRTADAVITGKLAKRLFGKDDPIGKTFVYSTGQVLTVAGVLGEPTTKSSMNFDLLVSSELKKQWNRMAYSIVRTAPHADPNRLNKKNANFMPLRAYSGNLMRLQFFPLKAFYFDQTIQRKTNASDAIFTQGNYTNIIVLSMVALLLLVVGIFNYVNIYTVVMLKRAREFGVKKVYGAGSGTVFMQIFVENLCMAVIALFLVWTLIEVSGGALESLLSIPKQSNLVFDVWLSVAMIFLFPLVTSIQPYLKYNYASPVTSIRSVNVSGHSVISRQVFLFAQYLVTFCLIVISLFFVKQLRFMLQADLGYQTKDIIQCKLLSEEHYYDSGSHEEPRGKREKDMQSAQVIKQRMDASPLFSRWEYGENPNRLTPLIPLTADGVEYHNAAYGNFTNEYMQMFGFQLTEGRLWDETDVSTQYKMIINESTKRLFGITDISETRLQPQSRLWWSSDIKGMNTNPPYEIIGVIKDFRINHLSKGYLPIIIVYDDKASIYDPLMAAIVPNKRQEAITFLRELHEEVIGKGDFEYGFLEDEIAAMYDEDKRVALIYVVFAVIAIFISCLGLFGLSLFDVRQRYREIALRKVNGATMKDILPLLLRKYALILSGAFLIAVPLSYRMITKYQEGFAYKAPVSWWLFAVAAGAVLFVSFFTLIWQVKRAAGINPAEVLKGE